MNATKNIDTLRKNFEKYLAKDWKVGKPCDWETYQARNEEGLKRREEQNARKEMRSGKEVAPKVARMAKPKVQKHGVDYDVVCSDGVKSLIWGLLKCVKKEVGCSICGEALTKATFYVNEDGELFHSQCFYKSRNPAYEAEEEEEEEEEDDEEEQMRKLQVEARVALQQAEAEERERVEREREEREEREREEAKAKGIPVASAVPKKKKLVIAKPVAGAVEAVQTKPKPMVKPKKVVPVVVDDDVEEDLFGQLDE
jgi:hypothetical protein